MGALFRWGPGSQRAALRRPLHPPPMESIIPWISSTPLHPTSTHTTYLLNLTGWRDDPENHIMYISLAVAAHLHVEDS